MRLCQSIVFTIALAVGSTVNAKALGINCRGSGNCPGVAGSLNDLISIVANIQGDRFYNNQENIACIKSQLGTGLCIFAQNSGGLPGSSVLPLLQALSGHGCGKCGSVPLFFPQGSNDPTFGILTVNAVTETGGCDGLC